MAAANRRRPRPPLDGESLAALALRYVERVATTRAKLASYLVRKVRERGWAEGPEPAIEAIVERFAASGYVDDAAFAMAKSRALSARGYGEGRLRQTLRAAGVEEGDAAPARTLAEGEEVEAALRFARRRRIGPFAGERPDIKGREKALGAMIRAGHGFAIARAIVDLGPGEAVDSDALIEKGVRIRAESV